MTSTPSCRLMLACAVAYGFTVIVMPRSILTEKIARRGHHVYREYGVDPLERHFVDDVMTRGAVVIDGKLPAAAALEQYFGAGHCIAPIRSSSTGAGGVSSIVPSCKALDARPWPRRLPNR